MLSAPVLVAPTAGLHVLWAQSKSCLTLQLCIPDAVVLMAGLKAVDAVLLSLVNDESLGTCNAADAATAGPP